MHTVPDNILTCQVSPKDHGSMGAVENTDFSLLIRLMVISDQHRKAGLGKGSSSFKD